MIGLVRSLSFLCLLITQMTSCVAQENQKKPRVMTWVPPYAIEACKESLNEAFDGLGPKHALSHLGLQFWHPTEEGKLKLVERFGKLDDSSVSSFRDWADKHNVKLMLCVYNGTSSGWDWALAKQAFKTHRSQFIEALVNEIQRLDLGGVDIDFEGKGALDADQEAFVLFIKELGTRLHALGKELTVDTFAYKWNAPNQTWWKALLPHVDGLNVMGYSETGAQAPTWRSYEFIKKAAGAHASKLLIGMPSHQGEWQDKPAKQQLQWLLDDGSLGLAIWDAQLKHPTWRKKSIWQQVLEIKEKSQP